MSGRINIGRDGSRFCELSLFIGLIHDWGWDDLGMG